MPTFFTRFIFTASGPSVGAFVKAIRVQRGRQIAIMVNPMSLETYIQPHKLIISDNALEVCLNDSLPIQLRVEANVCHVSMGSLQVCACLPFSLSTAG